MQTFSSNKIYDVLILPRGYQADDNFCMLFAYIFFCRGFGYAPFRLRIKFSAIRVYPHRCACPDRAAQMYFGSMNYTCIYITSNYLIVINQLFRLHGRPALGRHFPGKVDLISIFEFFSINWPLSRRYIMTT